MVDVDVEMVHEIFLVDDYPLVRRGLRGILQEESRLEVVGEAGSGIEALGVIRDLQTDLVMIGFAMEGVSGPEFIARLKQAMPEVLVFPVSV